MVQVDIMANVMRIPHPSSITPCIIAPHRSDRRIDRPYPQKCRMPPARAVFPIVKVNHHQPPPRSQDVTSKTTCNKRKQSQSPPPYQGNRIQSPLGQAGATIKRTVFDGGKAVRQGDAGQASATTKRIFPNNGEAVRQGDPGQAGAFIKRRSPYASDAVP